MNEQLLASWEGEIVRQRAQLSDIQQQVSERQVAYKLWEERRREAQESQRACQSRADLLDRVQVLLQLASERAREQACLLLQDLATKALRYIFGPDFRCEIVMTDKGGQPSAEVYCVTGGKEHEVRNRPHEARGGGIVDALSLALRIALLETLRPCPVGPLLLDEPGKHMSVEYVAPLVTFLTSVSTLYERQIIVVSHNPELIVAADRAYAVRQHAGVSHVDATSSVAPS
ncbi:ATP-binding protein [Pasteuria penetrans]|uniref:ATP-binding protein n=1 Tax=Pasteuria penetrans TaxID=86005 RepID=UPI000F9C2E8E|nr:ATP-binding protein [Pasteuria penetrans]